MKLRKKYERTISSLGLNLTEATIYIIKKTLLEPHCEEATFHDLLFYKNGKPKYKIFEQETSNRLATSKSVMFTDLELKQFRVVFLGVRHKSIGVRNVVIEKLTWFLNTYPQYTMENIIAAAKYHIQKSDIGRALQADNFIYSAKRGGSTLLTVLDEMELIDSLSDISNGFT